MMRNWMMSLRFFVALSIVQLMSLGCSETDITAPPAPWVDPIASPTTEAIQVVTGSAEYGSTVEITGGVEAVTVTADEFTARWRTEVTLNPIPVGEISLVTTLTATATDADSNTSDATTLDIELGPEPGKTTTIDFTLDPTATPAVTDLTIKAGDAVSYQYTTTDAYGTATDEPVIITVNSPDALVLNDGFDVTTLVGTGLILGLTRIGDFVVNVRSARGGAQVIATVHVGPADGERLIALGLTRSSMAMGDTVIVLITVTDLWGNLITTPVPSIVLEYQNGGTVPAADYVIDTADPNVYTINQPGVYRFTVTFDDGVNPAKSAETFLLVEDEPDLRRPDVRIVSVNGFFTCPDGTLKATVPADCTDNVPAVVFFPRTFVWVVVEADDDRALAQVSYGAFGLGLNASDFSLIGSGEHTPGTPIQRTFAFRVPRAFAPGDATLVAQAMDQAGKISNSTVTLLRLDLGLVASGGRTITAVVDSTMVTQPYDVAVASNGDIYIANNDNNDPVVLKVGSGGAVSIVATFGQPGNTNREPEYVTVDGAGNLFVADANDDIRIVDPTGADSVYDPMNNPEGLQAIPGGRAATGRFDFFGMPAAGDQVTVDDGTNAEVFEFFDSTGVACTLTAAFCIDINASNTVSTAMTALAAAINADANIPAAALVDDTGWSDCGGTGKPCVFLVHDVPGLAGAITLTESTGGSPMNATNVADGRDPSLLYVADRSAQSIEELQIPGGTATLSSWDLSGGGLNMCNQPTDVFPWLDGGRLRMAAVSENRDELCYHDSGSDTWLSIAQGGGSGLDQPWSVVVTATECALVANRGNGTIVGYDLTKAPGTGPDPTADPIVDGLDRPRGLALDINGDLLFVDERLQFVGRITQTPAPADCF